MIFAGKAYHHTLGCEMSLWSDPKYHVASRWVDTMMGRVMHICIMRKDGTHERDWRDYQRIKNELAYPEAYAIEVYPPESMLVDTTNWFHLWVLPEPLPIGFTERMVGVIEPQRPFEDTHD